MKVIGITGKIATGKSTLLSLFKKRNFIVFDSDAYIRTLSKKKGVQKKIAKFFPEAVENNLINKDKLRELSFKDNNIKILENIYHPLVIKKIYLMILIAKIKRRNIALEVPLLFETNLYKKCDYIFFTTVPEDLQKERFMKRSNTNDSAKKILSNILLKQRIMDSFKDRSDYVISMDKDIYEISTELDIILKDIGI